MTKDEAMRMALEALDSPELADEFDQKMKLRQVADALREALDEPEQEPVGYFEQEYVGGPVLFYQVNYSQKDTPGVIPLFAAPPRREWVSLTDEEISQAFYQASPTLRKIYQVIEAKLKELNHGS